MCLVLPLSTGGMINCMYTFWQGIRKTLVLREIPEDGVHNLLSSKDALAACDVAVFVHDR